MADFAALAPYLEDLENRLDAAAEETIRSEWETYVAGAFAGDLFSPRRPRDYPPGIEWPKVNVNDTLDDYDQMALQQLEGVSHQLANGVGNMLGVRCNYGVGILPSVFGVREFRMDYEQNCLPNVWPLDGGKDAVRRIVAEGPPDLENGYGGRVFEMGERYVQMMQPYPKVQRYIHVYHPDLQGPMDVCELLWGSQLFFDLVDETELVHAFLDVIVRTYIGFLRRWQEIVPAVGDTSMHWQALLRGHVMLRDDSAMNLSRAMFDEFIRPYDQRVLDEFGGGGIHFCGRGDHYISSIAEMRGVSAIFMSQPEYNDMEIIYRHTVDRGILLTGLQREVAAAALAAGRDLHGNVYCGG